MEFDSVRFKKFLQTYGKSEVIFEEGSFGFEMYVVRSGGVRIYRASAQGEIEVAIVKQGEFFGEMALVDNAPRSASACALEDDTRLIALDKDKFLFLISQQPTFALVVMHVLCKKIRSLSESVFPTG
ncbi:MAG: cyclic nucleotide-binding domain-containing protein [Syntrophobacteraceae bacterium]|jgi:CRP-like cAMP-binding protein